MNETPTGIFKSLPIGARFRIPNASCDTLTKVDAEDHNAELTTPDEVICYTIPGWWDIRQDMYTEMEPPNV